MKVSSQLHAPTAIFWVTEPPALIW